MLDKFFPLYVTVFLLTITLTAIFERHLIPKLKLVAKQPIYTDGPKWHEKKSGTPTMGGLAFVLASSIVIILTFVFMSIYNRESAVLLIICFVYAILNALIGLFDDYKKLKNRKNEGLKPKEKLILQIIAAIIFLLLRFMFLGNTTTISFSFGGIDLGFFYYPITLFILIGIVNSANLTDGIDGLASSVAFAIGVSLFYISATLSESVAILSAVTMGAAIGFLLFNLHPAKIFMGDTGSLFFGAITTSAAVSLDNPLLIIPIGAVYAFEGLSVVIQVLCFKITGKRVFKMAPFHHHLERCGWSENKICITAMLVTLITSIPVYIFYLP